MVRQIDGVRCSDGISQQWLTKNAVENEFATFVERENNLEDICDVKNERMEIRDLRFRINWREQ